VEQVSGIIAVFMKLVVFCDMLMFSSSDLLQLLFCNYQCIAVCQ